MVLFKTKISSLLSGTLFTLLLNSHLSSVEAFTEVEINNYDYTPSGVHNDVNLFSLDNSKDCPPCFNCLLPAFSCKQFAKCNEYNGRCSCPPGFGTDDCSEPVCGGLTDGINRPVRNGSTCACSDGWSGINCNMCTDDSSCDALMPAGLSGTCYKGGILVEKNYQMCKVTNRKILDILNGKIPEVTFNCNATSAECSFQFWIDQRESFYCGLDQCSFESEHRGSTNITKYHCENAYCKCIPERMLCGEKGSIDISDFLTETIKGPGDFQCDIAKGTCSFSEPSMNDLIKSVFGDPSISLTCDSTECLHYTQLPGYVPPKTGLNKKFVIASIVGAFLIIIIGFSAYQLLIKLTQDKPGGFISLPSEDDGNKLMAGHLPASLQFSDISYSDNEKNILNGVMGSVNPGEIMAIMGGSGAGKTTLLDILAQKSKRGSVTGTITVNGRSISQKEYRRFIGFVDQDDYLMPTLTVYETVVTSALLRLPKTMSDDSKKLRALETMKELGILGIKDQLIGSEENRGISGGEKRRVAIACELVTSPSILFLDEPTSGLDAYNAFNVVESLIKLARNFDRTVVFTIHQPRSNIVSLFDKLVLLASGQLVYSGPQSDAGQFFSEIGYQCPPGFNVADFLIDLTMVASGTITFDQDGDDEENGNVADRFEGWLGQQQGPTGTQGAGSGLNPVEVEDDIHSPIPRSDTFGIDATTEWRHYAVHRDELISPSASARNSAQLTRNVAQPVSTEISSAFAASKPISLEALVDLYNSSAMASGIREQISKKREEIQDDESTQSFSESVSLRGHNRIGFFKQFQILAVRTFKNLYRNPMLLTTHYIMSTLLAVFCGFLYYNTTNDISGFQNRLGLFFFLLALFGFSTLTSLGLFADERIIFVRERANEYYRPLSYYAAKVVFDIFPLRVFPPIILGLILYPLVGLSFEDGAFWKFLLILVLFNLTAAAACLVVGILIKNSGVANLVGSLFMLFSLLFAGLFLNHDSMPAGSVYIQYLSIFHYAYEALAVNEVKYLTLIEKKFGLSIEVPGATILSTFGFDASAVPRDIAGLAGFFVFFLIVGYVALHYLLVERR